MSVWNLLRKKFPANEYALMHEVRDKAGHFASNSADYVAVNLYPSRGLRIIGIEVKSSRGDWLRELKNPKKAENIFKHCDHFYLFTESESIAKMSEIPETWGWMTAKRGRVYTIKTAPDMQRDRSAIDRHFACAMLKRISQHMLHPSEINDRINEAVKEKTVYLNSEVDRLSKRCDSLTLEIKEFERASGVRMTGWNKDGSPEKIGDAVRTLISGGADEYISRLERLYQTADSIAKDIDQAMQSLKPHTNGKEDLQGHSTLPEHEK